MFWIALAILGIGAAVNIIGNVQQAQAKAKEDERKASQLEDLSKPGGYYDQELKAIQSDLQNVEADRAAAGKMLAISSIEITRQGAQAKGGVAATAGAGNLAQTGSISKRQDTITEQVNLNMAKVRLQYEGTLRGLATRAAQDTAAQTKLEFQQTAGTQDAAALKNEADWLSTWGVGLSIASGVTGFAASAIGMGGSPLGSQSKATPASSGFLTETGTAYGDPYASMSNVDWNSAWGRQY